MNKVLLYAPDWINIIEPFRKNLDYCGFEVDIVSFTKPMFKYKNFKQRTVNFFRKTFLRDLAYKQRLKDAYFAAHPETVVTHNNSYDYGLIIRADLLTIESLKSIRSLCTKMVSYHFDGLGRYPEVFERIQFFDDFFVFDPDDADRYPQWSLKKSTNFYFDYPLVSSCVKLQYPEFYYLGTYHVDRMQQILDLQQFLSMHNLGHKFEIIFPTKDAYIITQDLMERITCSTDPISFEDYLKRMNSAPIVLDFVLNEHSGLSFRVFESLQHEKKLITTNKNIIHYEFYHPDNIFVLDNNHSSLLIFLQKKYRPLPAGIKQKYAFSNWIKNIFCLMPFEEIKLPKF